jgi:hypothetical protein
MTNAFIHSTPALSSEQRFVRQYQSAIAKLIAEGSTPLEAADALLEWLQPALDRQKLAREIERVHPSPSPPP